MDYVGALGIVTVAYVMFTIGTVHKKVKKILERSMDRIYGLWIPDLG